MSPPKISFPTTVNTEYSNTAETQEKDLKTNFMEVIEFLKEDIIK